eukprot:5262894-Prymnesium_polylepis.1
MTLDRRARQRISDSAMRLLSERLTATLCAGLFGTCYVSPPRAACAVVSPQVVQSRLSFIDMPSVLMADAETDGGRRSAAGGGGIAERGV